MSVSTRASARVHRVLGATVLAIALGACTDSPTAAVDATEQSLQDVSPTLQRSSVSAGDYIVQFADREANPGDAARQLVAAHGGTLRHSYSHALNGFAATLPPQAVEALRRNPRIQLVEADVEMQLSGSGTQSTPPSWGLDRIDQRTRSFDKSYSWLSDGSGVHAYVFDTGIRSTHAEFTGRMGAGYTVVNDGNGTEDCHGHGTHVAGTVGGTTYGVAKAVQLHAVRVFGCTGGASTSGIIAALDWVVKNGERPAVANMSLGGSFSSSFNTAVANAVSAGIVVVVAAGNSSADACNASPASAPSAITVGSSGMTDAMSSFSNHGACVDIFAPGTSITSAYYTSNTASVQMSGTSMASPHAAGAAALVLSSNPSATPAQVTNALLTNATTGVLTSLPANTVNLLLFTAFSDGGSAPPPPPPPPAENVAPTASFAANCSSLSCSFTDQSSDSDGSIASRSWVFGDGGASSLTNPSRTYASAGSYTVTLTVTDNVGATHSTSRSVTVSAPTNSAPVASFSVSCQGNRSSCSFDASTSTDDAGIVRFEWNFGDGSPVLVTDQARSSYRYTRTGKFIVTLTVFDAAGLSSSVQRSVTIRRM